MYVHMHCLKSICVCFIKITTYLVVGENAVALDWIVQNRDKFVLVRKKRYFTINLNRGREIM
jgi:hypothetical protein